MAIDGFYWLIEGVLGGCARPGARRGAGDSLDDDLAWLRRQGIGAVLSLTESPLPSGALARHGLAELHLAVDDLRAPTPVQIEQALAFIDEQRARGRAVVVHCRMGQGRTGTVLAAYLIRGGIGAASALRELRLVCPGAVGSAEQEAALDAYAVRRDWLL
jgi:atypical dual specificity phosphatase